MAQTVFKTKEGQKEIQKECRKLYKKWPVNNQGRIIQTPYGDTYIIESGNPEKESLLLLHGSSSNSASWMEEAKLLSQKYHVVAVDLPGEPGLSSANRLPLEGMEISQWIESLIDILHIKQIHLIGMSLGGYYALRFASARPERVRSVFLIASSGLAKPKMTFLLKSLPFLFFGKWGIRRIYRILYGGGNAPEEVIDFGRIVMKHFNPITETVPVLSSRELKKLHMPVEYIGGLHDVMISTTESATRLKNLIPNATYYIFPDKGHVITGQADRILSFLKRA